MHDARSDALRLSGPSCDSFPYTLRAQPGRGLQVVELGGDMALVLCGVRRPRVWKHNEANEVE